MCVTACCFHVGFEVCCYAVGHLLVKVDSVGFGLGCVKRGKMSYLIIIYFASLHGKCVQALQICSINGVVLNPF